MITRTGECKLIVSRIRGEFGRFILTVVQGNEILETITANSAQLIKEYIDAEWPVGTRVQWIVV